MYPYILLEAFLPTNDRKGRKSFNMVTNSFFSLRLRYSSGLVAGFVLSFFWLSGFALGSFASKGVAFLFSSWMRSADLGSVSIVWLFASLLLPFLFSAFAGFFHLNWLVCCIAFCKAFVFAFCACGILIAFRNAGWLVSILLFFSDFLLFPWLYFFMLRCLSGKALQWIELTLPASFVFLTVSIDRCVISPFLASLI